MKKFQKGFTLIELLVVIAIIGILASVVLVNLNSARDKGTDAKVKTTLSNIRSAAEIAADGGSYASVCDATDIGSMITSLGGVAATNCEDSATAWVVSVDLPGVADGTGVGFWCVDSTGAATNAGATPGTDLSCAAINA